MTPALTHISEHRRLLTLEYEAEKAALTRVADRMDPARLVATGLAWWPVRRGNIYYNSLNRRVVEIFRTGDFDPETETEFEYGRAVTFFDASGAPGDTLHRRVRGTVNFADASRMVIAVDDGADLGFLDADGRQAGVLLSFDETSYRAMFDALDALAAARGTLGELRDLVYSKRPASSLVATPLRFPYLNPSQEAGVNNVLTAREVAVVHGPPGTGKTTTLVEAIHETLRREPQVMVCAQSNKAVDWIASRLAERGISVLRLGNPSRVDDNMLAATYERRFESHPEYSTLWSIRRTLREMYGTRRGRSESQHARIERLKDRATELELRIHNDIMASVQVVASTLVGSASRTLRGATFNSVFIDEAAQALEAACWIPMQRARRMILAGDHCQLPPTVKCPEAMRAGLGRSLMEVIVENHPECVTLLTVQYRMHNDIMRFPSDWFYGSKLTAAPEVSHRGILDLDTPVEWVDTSHLQPADIQDTGPTDADLYRETMAGDSPGRVNPGEAALTLDTLEAYIGRIGIERLLDEHIDIGIISPYRAQVRCLRRLLARRPWARRLRGRISVNTVDGFQGSERDVIVLSLVRSNDSADIGFLRDLRRINVAITRARMKLIIIGDGDTLAAAHPFYRRLRRYITSLKP